MVRVLYLIKNLRRGGAEQLLLDVARRLDRAKFSPEIIYASHSPNEMIPEYESAGLPVTCLGARNRPLSWLSGLRRTLHERQYDILHAHSPYVAAGARLLPRSSHLRMIYTEHNEWSTYHYATRLANALTYWRNDSVLAVSDQVRDAIRLSYVSRLFPAPPVDTLYHGIDLADLNAAAKESASTRAELEIPEGSVVVGTVANFRPQKGYDVLVRSVAAVRDACPSAHFVFVGGGPTEEKTRRQVAALGLDDRVTFAGYRGDATRVAATFDIFALSSFHEGLPVAVAESMAIGKPIVATEVGGTPELVEDGAQGLLVPAGDHRAFADAVSRLVNEPETRRAMGRSAARRAREFDIRHTVEELERIYLEHA